MLISIIVFIAALAVLVLSGEYVVRSALRLSQLIGLSEFAIGFILLAVGSSLPELSIAVMSIFEKSSSLSIGNLFGSSIIDITLILGIVCMFGFVLKKKDVEISEIIIFSSLVAFFALILGFIDAGLGIFALIIFFAFIIIVFKRHYTIKYNEKKPWILTPELVKHCLIIAFSLAAVVVSAKFVVSSAIEIAFILNIQSIIIGAVLVSLGTTLPELIIAIMAMRKHNVSLALGNVVGSVIVNISLILGILALASPFVIDKITAILITLFLSINAVFLVLVWKKRFGIAEGLVLIFMFMIFMTVMLLGTGTGFLG